LTTIDILHDVDAPEAIAIYVVVSCGLQVSEGSYYYVVADQLLSIDLATCGYLQTPYFNRGSGDSEPTGTEINFQDADRPIAHLGLMTIRASV